MENLSTSHPLVRKLREGWGKVRRLALCHVRPGKVRAGIRTRRGACKACAECCDLLFRCPYLDEARHCTIYERRFKPCAAFPIDGRDVKNMDCGFHFEREAPPWRPLGLPFAPWARREISLMGVAALLGGASGLAIAWLDGVAAGYAVAAAFACLFLFTLFFFRDPWRAVPKGENTLLAPADGRVTDVRVVEEDAFLKGRAHRVGVFMSLFDVHVNRVPDDGEVRFLHHRDGESGNVLFEKAWERNENLLIGFEGRRGPLAVRLVAGAVANRIASDLETGDRVERGGRMGMVKFGSRAEVLVPVEAGWRPLVQEGQKVKAGRSALFGRDPAPAGSAGGDL
ncbi:MAG: phosphatidylserine decarboxylase [Planctomycetota bacterium]|jgi:phosphatidylserine decarboxylase